MKRYLYSYQTIIRFNTSITRHSFKLRGMPCENAFQRVVESQFIIHPAGTLTHDTDTWGNEVQYGHRTEAHDSFVCVSSGIVEVTPYALPAPEAEILFCVPSALTGVSPMMEQFYWNLPQNLTSLDTALALATKVHNYMQYTTGATTAATTAMQAFASKLGVCQDYAHILIALCRANGIPARYACGLLQGTGETHAWVEVYAEGTWQGIDPTHNQLITYGYIKIAHGRDAADCPVNRGVFTGNAAQLTEVRVIVEEI